MMRARAIAVLIIGALTLHWVGAKAQHPRLSLVSIIGILAAIALPEYQVYTLRAKLAEGFGFTHGWTFDSHVLWQEPFVIYSQILAATERMVVGPMVTNPGTRDWTVLASLFATLNEMFGDRTICGMGRGDSALRYIGRKPTTLVTMVEAMEEEAFGACTNFRACEAVCPKEISISGIARMNKDYRKALFSGVGFASGKKR